MSKEVIYLDPNDSKRAVKPNPLTIEQFIGFKKDPTTNESIEEYVNYRIQFEKEIKLIELNCNYDSYDYEKIVYLGKSYSDDDTFACFNGSSWQILLGKLNSGLY